MKLFDIINEIKAKPGIILPLEDIENIRVYNSGYKGVDYELKTNYILYKDECCQQTVIPIGNYLILYIGYNETFNQNYFDIFNKDYFWLVGKGRKAPKYLKDLLNQFISNKKFRVHNPGF